MLDTTIALLASGLASCRNAFLTDLVYHVGQGLPVDAAALTASSSMATQQVLALAVRTGWQSAWETTGDSLLRIIRARADGRRIEQHASPGPPPSALPQTMLPEPPRGYQLPSPLRLPATWRTFDETHVPGQPTVSRATWEWLAEHEAELQLQLPAEYVSRYIQTRVPPLARVTDEALKRAAARVAAAVAERGFGVRQTITALRAEFPEFSRARLENIARTEGAHLYETGHVARYLESPAVQGVRFDAVGDSRTTAICLWHDGKCWLLTDADCPHPPLHFACRSTLAPVLIDESPAWQTEPPPEQSRPLTGFGRIDAGLLPENATIQPGFNPAAAIAR